LLGICPLGTGDRLAKAGSTARLIPTLRARSRGARLLRSVTSRRLLAPRSWRN